MHRFDMVLWIPSRRMASIALVRKAFTRSGLGSKSGSSRLPRIPDAAFKTGRLSIKNCTKEATSDHTVVEREPPCTDEMPSEVRLSKDGMYQVNRILGGLDERSIKTELHMFDSCRIGVPSF